MPLPKPPLTPQQRALADRIRRARPPRDSMPDDVCAVAMRLGVIDEVEARAEALMYTSNVSYGEACALACRDVLERIQEEAA